MYITGKMHRNSTILAAIFLVLSLPESICQTIHLLDFTENNIEFLNLPAPGNGFYTRVQNSTSKPLYINSFATNHELPVMAEDIYMPAGPFKNTFFGGDNPNMAGFGHVSSMVLWDKKITENDFPILVEAEFFNRSKQPAYNESYFWIGNKSHEYYNPALSTLPSQNVQEGLILGGIINRFLIQNGDTPDNTSIKYYDFEHKANQINEWYKMTALVDINDDKKLVFKKITINSVSVLSKPVVIDNMSYFELNNLQLGVCVDDFAKNFKVIFNYPIDDTYTEKYNCGFVDTTLCYSIEAFPQVDFAIAKRWESDASTSLYQAPLLMDMDNDCIPEIVASGLDDFLNNPRITSGITLINSATGQTKYTIQTPYYSWGGPTTFALADINADAYPEMVVAAADVPQNPANVRGRLVCYNSLGNLLWISNDQYGKFTSTSGSGGAPAFADFNQDGIPEVYIYNEIFNALTGVKLADGGFLGQGISSRSFNNFSYATSIAADLDDNPDDLELAAGYTIYQVTINNPDGTAGNLMEARPILLNNQFKDGHTSVADVNLDGILDVVVASQGNQNTSRLYAYYLRDGAPVLLAQTTMPSTGGGCCTEACGIAFVGDMTGNGRPVIGITRAYMLLTYQYDGTTTLKEYWRLSTNDESGSTGMTMFDFNQDGVQEIVYRDENQLRIINGAVSPPVNLASFGCTSGTGAEYPIVGDISFSGESNICVPCASGNSRTTGKIHVFGAPINQQPWAPSRGIWNQYTYHVFNINDDLTIPVKPLNNATYAEKRFNNYLVQASLLDSAGNFLQTSTDVTGEISCVYYDDLSGVYSVTFELSNLPTASAAVTDPVQVFFYNGNPLQNGRPIGFYTINQPLPPGRKIAPLEFIFSASSVDTLYLFLNTKGDIMNVPSGLAPDFNGGECNYANNILLSSAVQSVISFPKQICEGDSVLFDGKWYDTAGIYTFTKPAVTGCDTISRLVLGIVKTNDTAFIREACEGDSIFIDQNWIKKDTAFSVNLLNVSGCDSIVRYDIRFFTADTLQEYRSACQGDSVRIKNKWYYDNSFVRDTLPALPCPTYVNTRADFYSVYQFAERFSLCPGDSLPIHGLTFFQGGEYRIDLKTAQGCDSVYLVEIDEINGPVLPVFIPDCNEQTYTAQINPTAGWSHRWEDGSTSLVKILDDSLSGYVDFYYDSIPCLYRSVYNLDKIPETTPLIRLTDTVVYPGKPIFLNLPIDSSIWDAVWLPSEIISCDTCFQVTVTPFDDVDLLLRLYHISGCVYNFTLRADVDATLDILIPNIFSPDLTGPNQAWTWFIPDCFSVMSLQVYDRWGNLVLSSANPAQVNWDGTFNGSILEAGVYTFVTRYERPDGSIVNKTGDVTIIRL